MPDGVYIDVGACHPTEDSVTKIFYDQGWRGVNIEPSPHYFSLLQRERPDDINLLVACTNTSGTMEFTSEDKSGLSSLKSTCNASVSSALRQGIQKTVVYSTTLNSIIDSYSLSSVHFLKIDVEGSELEVLQGYKFDSPNTPRPWIIVVEVLLPMTRVSAPHRDLSRQLLSSHNYNHVFFDGLNDYYLCRSRLYLENRFGTPPCCLDGFTSTSPSAIRLQLEDLNKSIDHLRTEERLASKSLDQQCKKFDNLEACNQELEAEVNNLRRLLDDAIEERTVATGYIYELQNEIQALTASTERLVDKLNWLRTQRVHLSLMLSAYGRIMRSMLSIFRRTCGSSL